MSSDYTITHEEALKLEYPYRRIFMSSEQVDEAFHAVCAYKLNLVNKKYIIKNMNTLPAEFLHYNGKPTICALRKSDYYTMTWLSDYFTEKCRLAGKRCDEASSPLQYWAENRAAIVSAAPNPAKMIALSDAVYGRIRGCGNFRPGLLRGFIEHFGAKSALDPSSGWGDRLIGAIAAGVRYVGVDPNPALQPGYAEIITRFAADPAKYTMISASFQAYESDEKFDLVFTSPPYFDLEIYSGGQQSTEEFPTLTGWFEGFLMVMAAKSWAALNPGGHLVIVINDAHGGRVYTEEMVKRISIFTGAQYLGVISYAETCGVNSYRSPQPMWIWKKRE